MSTQRRRHTSIVANPLLLGSIAILVVAYGIYLAYQATTGLPYVPRYRVDAELPNSSQIVKAADVTIAGSRVGQVVRVRAQPGQDGKDPVAVLELSIEKRYEPLPVDTTITVRISGSLGRKFVELTPGTSSRTIPDGGTLAVTQAKPQSVEIDELLNTFRAPVRAGVQGSLRGLGTGFAGRGAGLNGAIESFAPMLADLTVVSRTLASDSTRLGPFVRSLESLAAELAPVSGDLPGLFTDLDTTFTALASVSTELQDSIAQSPQTLDAATAEFAHTAPLLRESTTLLASLRPSGALLPGVAPVLAGALEAGTENLPKVPALSDRLDPALEDLADFAEEDAVGAGVDRLRLTARALGPLAGLLAPAQTRCSYPALLVRNVASTFKEGVDSGTTVRAGGVVVGVDPDSERGPSKQAYQGIVAKALGPLHANPYPNTFGPGQTAECEAGHEPYITNRMLVGNIPGAQGAKTEATTLP